MWTIEESARRGLIAKSGFYKKPGLCAGWVRQVIAKSEFKALTPPQGLDAREQFHHFASMGFSIPVEQGTERGDLLYKIADNQGKHGHVGIRILGNRVAENSSVHSHNGSDARGTRSVEEFGRVTGIIRLRR